MRGSPLGIGSDIGGSVRSPAAACGIFSFKPSIGRVPNTGAETLSAAPGYEGIISTLGPMGHSVEDLELIMKIVADAKPWNYDPSLQVKPWRKVEQKGKLRVGVLRDDGVVRPVGSVQRALDYAVDKLKKNPNFEVVEYKPYKSERSWELIVSRDRLWKCDQTDRAPDQLKLWVTELTPRPTCTSPTAASSSTIRWRRPTSLPTR